MLKKDGLWTPHVGMVALGVFVLALILLLLIGHGFLAATVFALVLAAGIAAYMLFALEPEGVRLFGLAGGPDPSSSREKPKRGDKPAAQAGPAPQAAAKSTAGTGAASESGQDPTTQPASDARSTHAEVNEEERRTAPPDPSLSDEPDASEAQTLEAQRKEPARLDGPREGDADDLKKIKGIGPKLESELNKLGIYHVDQIASWSEEEVAWMDDNLVEFRGRVSRDDWVGQARQLSSGGETDASRRADEGNTYH